MGGSCGMCALAPPNRIYGSSSTVLDSCCCCHPRRDSLVFAIWMRLSFPGCGRSPATAEEQQVNLERRGEHITPSSPGSDTCMRILMSRLILARIRYQARRFRQKVPRSWSYPGPVDSPDKGRNALQSTGGRSTGVWHLVM